MCVGGEDKSENTYKTRYAQQLERFLCVLGEKFRWNFHSEGKPKLNNVFCTNNWLCAGVAVKGKPEIVVRCSVCVCLCTASLI